MQKTYRLGKHIEVDEAFLAWTSGDLFRMLNALKVKTNVVDRHHLLQSIVKETYKQRSQSVMREKCKEISILHIKEFPVLVDSIEKHHSSIPSVSTFKYYAIILTEDAQFDDAIEVCKKAIAYDYGDGTVGGYEGRIKRIEKARTKQLNQSGT